MLKMPGTLKFDDNLEDKPSFYLLQIIFSESDADSLKSDYSMDHNSDTEVLIILVQIICQNDKIDEEFPEKTEIEGDNLLDYLDKMVGSNSDSDGAQSKDSVVSEADMSNLQRESITSATVDGNLESKSAGNSDDYSDYSYSSDYSEYSDSHDYSDDLEEYEDAEDSEDSEDSEDTEEPEVFENNSDTESESQDLVDDSKMNT